jgi:hypothetical protein
MTTTTNTTSNSRTAPGTRAFIGIVARTIGTAPRSPAQVRKARYRHGIRSRTVDTSTAAGRAMATSTHPVTRAGMISPGSRAGLASKPSKTNSPI